MKPHEFPRRVLLAAAGMTPQVITETLFALGHLADPVFPTEVHVVTTTFGRERILLELLGEESPWFLRLYRDYPFPPPLFEPSHIHVIAHNGAPLRDIRDEAENAAAADAIAAQIRSLTADPECAIHISLAGGRKTMSYFAGAALSLYGRPQDRLSHVLVSDAFEANTQFFYPTPRQRVIYTRDNKPLDAAEAKVTLADIPFVRLRQWLPEDFLTHHHPFLEAIEHARLALEPQALRVHVPTRAVILGSKSAQAAPAELAFFLWVLRRQRERLPVTCPSDGGAEAEPALEFLMHYNHVQPDSTQGARTARALRNGMEQSYFLQRRSRWNGFLKERFGLAATPFHIQPEGPRGQSRYGIAATKDQLEIISNQETPA